MIGIRVFKYFVIVHLVLSSASTCNNVNCDISGFKFKRDLIGKSSVTVSSLQSYACLEI